MKAGTVKAGTVYRLRGEAGDLLYVGVSLNAITRVQQHSSKPWWTEVASATFEHFADYEDATRAEVEAIQAENPKYNLERYVDGKRNQGRTRTHYSIGWLRCTNCGAGQRTRHPLGEPFDPKSLTCSRCKCAGTVIRERKAA